MKVTEDKVISLIYELRRDNKDGELVEALTEENPLTFLYGSGNLLSKFENNILGLGEGDKFNFTLSSDDAYGSLEDNAIVNIPLVAFEVDGKVDYNLVKTGSSIPMVDSEGRRLTGIIKSIGDDSVKMDFNHPMAGATLHFSGKITSIREASPDEITHGHIHTPKGCHGCDHGSCGEDC